MHMTAYLAGDTDVFAVRTASKEKVLLTVDLPDQHASIGLTIDHDGTLHLSGQHRVGTGWHRTGSVIGRIDTDTGRLELTRHQLETVI